MGATRRVTLREAADVLGISKEGVRKRVKRGKLRSDKDPDGRVYVYLPLVGDEGTPGPGPEQDPRDRLIATLQDQLDQEREARRRADTIIAQLSQANAEMARTVRALEAPTYPDRPPEAPQDAGEGMEGVDPPDRGGASQAAVQRRSWWRRFFGFE